VEPSLIPYVDYVSAGYEDSRAWAAPAQTSVPALSRVDAVPCLSASSGTQETSQRLQSRDKSRGVHLPPSWGAEASVGMPRSWGLLKMMSWAARAPHPSTCDARVVWLLSPDTLTQGTLPPFGDGTGRDLPSHKVSFLCLFVFMKCSWYWATHVVLWRTTEAEFYLAMFP